MADQDPFRDLRPELREAMEQRGFSELTAVQNAVLTHDHEGKDLRLSSQTGSGKTVAIGIVLASALLDGQPERRVGPIALVITPTRELAAQVQRELDWLFSAIPKFQVGVVTGGTDIGRERRFLSRKPTLIVGTPGRILDHMRAGALDFSDLQHVVLDEADQMLDMGFREELDAIVEALPKERRSHLVSATFPPQVRRLADRFQQDVVRLEGTKLGDANQDIEHAGHLVHPDDRDKALINALLLADGEQCLVFVRRRSDAAEIAEMLASQGFSAQPFSGDLPQAQRSRTLGAFRQGIIKILVATDVAARGIDVANISLVIHLDPPSDAAVYTHRSGRTGRAGKKGKSLLLMPARAHHYVKRTLEAAKIEFEWTPLPNAKKIKKAAVKRARSTLHRALEKEQPPSEAELEYAAKLLETNDPKVLIARLMELSENPLPREPFDLRPVEPSRSKAERGLSRGGSRNAARGGARGGPSGPSVRFHINWGRHNGATPSRILAHICRRGDISSRSIGALDISARTSTFEVSQDLAERFESQVQKPDSRDPRIRIVRARDENAPPPPHKKFKGPRPRRND